MSANPQTAALEQASVRQYCRAVRTPAIAANFLAMAGQAVKENRSHVHYLEALLALECEERDRHAIENRIRDAQLPRIKTLEEFDFTKAPQIPAAKIRELAEGGYIERSEPVVLIGECGTGKSHLATGLCLAACRQKRRVRFVTAAALVNELVEAKQNGQVRRAMAKWQRYELIAIDEVGYVPLADVGAEFLFQVISERAERAAILLTTNLLCGAPHNRFNAESVFMRTPHASGAKHNYFAASSVRIIRVVFSRSSSLSVALKRPVRSLGAITDSNASSFTLGSARV